MLSRVELAELRVLQLIPSLYYGGLERVAVTLTVHLAPRVRRIVVCTKGGDAFRMSLVEAGIPILQIPRPRPRPRAQLAAARVLARVIRREEPDVIHAWNPAASLAAALARRLARRPEIAIVSSYQGVYDLPISRAAWALTVSADVVASLTPTSTELLLEHGLPPSRVVTVYNAVPGKTARGPEEVRAEFGLNGSELVVNVARYAREKNQALLIDALAELAPRRPSMRALIVGEGDLRPELQARIEDHGLGGVVQLTGPREDAVDIVAAADVFALSSNDEAMGVVLLEAMSVGCPIAAVAGGGVPDVLDHERTALLVPRRDPFGLAAAIERLLDDPALGESLAENGRGVVGTKFSVETMVERFGAIYESVVEARRG
jgi:glycosyltransferase involved in cell wall biosynthesis